MATVFEPIRQFEIGRVFGRSFGVITRNLPLYLGLGVLLVGVPKLVIALLFPLPRTAAEFIAAGGMPWRSMLLSGIVSYVFTLVLEGTLVRATIEDLSDRTPNFGECLATGFRMVLPILGIAVVSGICIFGGLFMLVVPGVIVWVMWSVAVPAEIEERRGIFASLGRSRSLTRGSRWRIFALLVITLIAVTITQYALIAVASPFGTTVARIVGALLRAVSSAVLSTVVAATYVELRTVKEGADISTLAAVFS